MLPKSNQLRFGTDISQGKKDLNLVISLPWHVMSINRPIPRERLVILTQLSVARSTVRVILKKYVTYVTSYILACKAETSSCDSGNQLQ